MNYWLMKSEGDCYSIDDLKKDKVTPWSGVRNYQARNFMRDHMKKGDMVLFYHSSSKPTGVYGIAKVTANAHADETQFEKGGEYYDPKSTREHARWQCVDVRFVIRDDGPRPWKSFINPACEREAFQDYSRNGEVRM